jgi:hypothetical protein
LDDPEVALKVGRDVIVIAMNLRAEVIQDR